MVSNEARRWVEQAAQDLDHAALLAEHGRYATACFLVQQSAEKALEGVLYAAGADAVLGLSVRTLCEEVAARAPEIAQRGRQRATARGVLALAADAT